MRIIDWISDVFSSDLGGIAYDQLDLWSYDHYHASIAGYYLEALVVFAGITGKDPRTLGKGENAAGDLGLSGEQAARLQRVAVATVLGQDCTALGAAAGEADCAQDRKSVGWGEGVAVGGDLGG